MSRPTALQLPLDLVALVKPRITALVVCTTFGGLYLAPVAVSPSRLLYVLVGTVLVVGGANTLNMYLERDTDALMRRTAARPLPAGRMSPRLALWFGIALGALAVPLLAWKVNALTALLGASALVGYVLLYTPLKRRSSSALLVGAVPGAIPPLMGWTAATGTLDLPGAVLFGVLFLWQVPHFLAIALYSKEDYARGGIQVMPLVEGEAAAKRRIVLFLAALVPVSLALVPLGVAGRAYLAVALVGGAAFFAWGVYGLRARDERAWSRSLFLVSLVYLTSLFVVLAVEGRRHG
jgi:protoheme IX farnesyltransferase